MKSNDPLDYGFDSARDIDASLRGGKLPEGVILLPEDTEHIVYKGFAAYFGVGSLEQRGVLDDVMRKRYPGVEVSVNPISFPDELPVFLEHKADLLPGFYYTFNAARRRR